MFSASRTAQLAVEVGSGLEECRLPKPVNQGGPLRDLTVRPIVGSDRTDFDAPIGNNVGHGQPSATRGSVRS
jgi:hypothetical protein